MTLSDEALSFKPRLTFQINRDTKGLYGWWMSVDGRIVAESTKRYTSNSNARRSIKNLGNLCLLPDLQMREYAR